MTDQSSLSSLNGLEVGYEWSFAGLSSGPGHVLFLIFIDDFKDGIKNMVYNLQMTVHDT